VTAPLRGIKPAVSYNLREAALAIGVSERLLSEAAEAHDIPSHWLNSRRLFLATDLVKFIESLPPVRATG
jgi:hypothetical protein